MNTIILKSFREAYKIVGKQVENGNNSRMVSIGYKAEDLTGFPPPADKLKSVRSKRSTFSSQRKSMENTKNAVLNFSKVWNFGKAVCTSYQKNGYFHRENGKNQPIF